MSESGHSTELPLESQRVPLNREVVLKFDHFSNFIQEYSANISLGGMFIKTSEPKLRGTVFRFEVRLRDEEPLVAGLGKVLWVRSFAEGPDRPAGMGVRFLSLEPGGRELIQQIVEEHGERGGAPFDLGEPGVAAGRAEREVASPEAAPPGAPAPAKPAAAVLDAALPVLDELLDEREKPSEVSMQTPPRGWKPRAFSVRPRTRPQLLAAIAVAGLIVAALVYLLIGYFSRPPELPTDETTPRELPRQAAADEEQAAEGEPAPEPLEALKDLGWRRTGGGVEVTIEVEGGLPEGSWSESRLTDPPRQLVQFNGVSRPYPTRTIEVGAGGVRQLRTGYHSRASGSEQHVVIDLVDPRVVLDKAQAEGSTLRLTFRRVGG